MIRSDSPDPDARCREGDDLATRALGRFLRCGSWTATSGALVRALGSSADAAPIADALTRAAASWHGVRAAIERAFGEAAEHERTAALAEVLVDARETLGSRELVHALLERHAETPPGRALDPRQLDAALTQAFACHPDNASDGVRVRRAA